MKTISKTKVRGRGCCVSIYLKVIGFTADNFINFFLDFNKEIYPDITKYENKTLYEKVKRHNEVIMEYFKSAIEEAEEEQNKEKKLTL